MAGHAEVDHGGAATPAAPRPADPDLAAQFHGWEIGRGTDGLMHAWLVGTDPPLVVGGEDETSLRNQIRAIAMRALP